MFTVSDEVQLCASVGSNQCHPKTQKGKMGAFNHSEGKMRIWRTAQVVMPGEGGQQGDNVNGFHPELADVLLSQRNDSTHCLSLSSVLV